MTERPVVICVYTLKEFDYKINDFKIFSSRLRQFFLVNDINDEDKKRAYLLNFLSEKTYKLLVSLCAPKIPEETLYKDLQDILQKHLTSKQICFLEDTAKVKNYLSIKNMHVII